MAKMTMHHAAKALGMPKRTLQYHISHGHVTYEQRGRASLIDPEMARQELGRGMGKISMHQAAKVLGIPEHTISSYVKHGQITGQRVGSITLIDPDGAREELKQAGYYQQSAAYWEKIIARAVARRQAAG